jgi:hypothetical protein
MAFLQQADFCFRSKFRRRHTALYRRGCNLKCHRSVKKLFTVGLSSRVDPISEQVARHRVAVSKSVARRLPRGTLPRRALKEFSRIDVQYIRQLFDDLKSDIGNGAFDAAEIDPIDPGIMGQRFLRQFSRMAHAAKVDREKLA